MNNNDRRFFASLAIDVQGWLELLQRWQADNPRVADYRVADALTALAAARQSLELLAKSEHGPEWYSAMAKFRASLAKNS